MGGMDNDQFLTDILRKGMIYMDGDIDSDMAIRIGKSILWLNAQDDIKEISLYINSGGGSVVAGFDIYDIIRHSKTPVTGVVYRYANSMATVVLQACKVRKALRHGDICIHNIKINEEWHKFEENLEEALRVPKKNQQEIYEIMAERTGRSMEEIRNAFRESKTMCAEEAKEFGLIDEII